MIFLVILTAITALSNILIFLPKLGLGYFIFFIFLPPLLVFFHNNKIYISCLIFLIICSISILLNDVPSIFRAWQRLGIMTLILFTCGPFFFNIRLLLFRKKLFFILQHAQIWITLLSFILLPFYSKMTLYAGVTVHSMILAPISALSILFLIYKIKLGKNRRHRFLAAGMVFIAFITILTTGSRIALGAVLMALCCFLPVKSFLKNIRILILLLCILFSTHNIWYPYFDALMARNADHSFIDFSSRDRLWEDRLDEFISHPLVGIGFASISLESDNAINQDSGGVECGSGWLALLSMTGLLGLGAFLWLILPIFSSLVKQWRTGCLQSGYLLAVGVFWMVHMFAEAYWFAAGSYLFLIFWLWLGFCADRLQPHTVSPDESDTKEPVNV